MAVFQAAVEGDLDETVARRVVKHAGSRVDVVYGRSGKDHLRQNVGGYNHAAKWTPWFVLVDLDRDHDCAPALRATWLPEESTGMCFRVAVREIESWLMADRRGFARFMGVSQAVVPADPDALDYPKRTLVTLAARSRWRAIRESIPPVEGSHRAVGPLYNPTLGQFVHDHWDVDRAAETSNSLRRCLDAVASVGDLPDP